MTENRTRLLRIAFFAGALTDTLALIPMLYPPMTRLMWGFEDLSEPYKFAMGYGASLMAGWTALLLWAYQKPIDRAFVAVLTIVVIAGLIATEIRVVWVGALSPSRMIPTWIIQATLLVLFLKAYLNPSQK